MKDVYPLLHIDNALDCVQGVEYFSSLSSLRLLASAYGTHRLPGSSFHYARRPV